MAKYKVRIFDPKRGFRWVADELLNEDGALVDTGSVLSEEDATLYRKENAELIADFLRQAFAEQNSHETVEVVE